MKRGEQARGAFPWYYTDVEGGPWIRWTSRAVNQQKLHKLPAYNGVTTLFGIKIHSLAFEDPKYGEGKFPRWDCINRWTTSLAQAREANPFGLHGEKPLWNKTRVAQAAQDKALKFQAFGLSQS